ncbi:MAG: rhomboid family intramembrane serine protease [Candidatus Obscuribacter sp.]|nr:rhomboid family intramembrane serine protease [Candidatus Obscuribacter sp.]
MILLEDHRLWLLLILSGLSLGIRLMQPLPWALLSILQPLIVISGVVVPALLGDAQLALWIGWCLFLFFHVPAIITNYRTAQAINTLNSVALESWARVYPWLNWGTPGLFWQDIYLAYASFLEDKASEGFALLDKWKAYRKLPKQLANTPDSYRLAGQCILWQWQDARATYESFGQNPKFLSPSTHFQASRAYLELQDFDQASACIKAVHLDEIIYPLPTLATNLMPYFALSGSQQSFDHLTKVMEAVKAKAPPVMIDYWQGRLYLVNGERLKAKETFEKALAETPQGLYLKRIRAMLDPLLAEQASGTLSDDCAMKAKANPSQVNEIWLLFKRAAFIQEILAPARNSTCVNVISFICLAVFLLSNSFLMPLGFDSPLNVDPELLGASYQTVVKDGQYWRLITYMFYHASILHIASNIYALYIFGRITENLFGSARFLGIFFVGGILSGLAHVILSQNLAVGASGAIQAIFAACAVAIIRLKTFLPPGLRSRYLGFMLGMTVFQVVLDQIIPFIAVFAHLGGLVAVWLWARLQR